MGEKVAPVLTDQQMLPGSRGRGQLGHTLRADEGLGGF